MSGFPLFKQLPTRKSLLLVGNWLKTRTDHTSSRLACIIMWVGFSIALVGFPGAYWGTHEYFYPANLPRVAAIPQDGRGKEDSHTPPNSASDAQGGPSVKTCDNLAADPDDIRRIGIGPLGVSSMNNPGWVAEICNLAIATAITSDVPRLRHEHARALAQKGDSFGALSEYHLAADAGYAPSAAQYGQALYRDGHLAEAFKYFQAASVGSALGEYWLGTIYKSGLPGVVPPDPDRGDKLIREAAMRGNALARIYLASR